MEKKPLRMLFSLKNPVNRQFCRENVNIRAPGMKFWSILAQFTLGKYHENIAIILHQMKYRVSQKTISLMGERDS